MQAHIIEGGFVVNTIVVDSLDALPGVTLVDAGLGGKIGDELVNGEFISPEPPAPEPAESVPMLSLQLVLIDDGKLTSVEGIINGMEGADGDRARAYWAKALTARRDNYLVNLMWPAIGYDLAGFNDAWARAAALNP